MAARPGSAGALVRAWAAPGCTASWRRAGLPRIPPAGSGSAGSAADPRAATSGQPGRSAGSDGKARSQPGSGASGTVRKSGQVDPTGPFPPRGVAPVRRYPDRAPAGIPKIPRRRSVAAGPDRLSDLPGSQTCLALRPAWGARQAHRIASRGKDAPAARRRWRGPGAAVRRTGVAPPGSAVRRTGVAFCISHVRRTSVAPESLTRKSGTPVRGRTPLDVIAGTGVRSRPSMASEPPANREAAQRRAGLGLSGQALRSAVRRNGRRRRAS